MSEANDGVGFVDGRRGSLAIMNGLKLSFAAVALMGAIQTKAEILDCRAEARRSAARIEEVVPPGVLPIVDGAKVPVGACLSPGTQMRLPDGVEKVVVSEPGDRVILLRGSARQAYVAPPLPAWPERIRAIFESLLKQIPQAPATKTGSRGGSVIASYLTSSEVTGVVQLVDPKLTPQVVLPSHIGGRCRMAAADWQASRADPIHGERCTVAATDGRLQFVANENVIEWQLQTSSSEVPLPPGWDRATGEASPASRLVWGAWLSTQSPRWSLQAIALMASGRAAGVAANDFWYDIVCKAGGADDC